MRTRSLPSRIALVAGALFSLGGVARADLYVNQWHYPPICTDGCLPDVIARYEPEGNSQGFRVYNVSDYAAGAFHIAVWAGQNSHGIDVAGIPAHGSVWYPVQAEGCGSPVTVILNTFNALPESNYNNNALTFTGWCDL
jgi:hypothetical protein